jgi:TonB-linked SusC/RagA family outer membrane protein
MLSHVRRTSSLLASLGVAMLFAVPFAHAGAQGAGTITGRVTEARTGRPVASAQVQVPGTTISAATGPNGEYTLNNVPSGTTRLRARRIGYTSADQTISVSGAQPAVANFSLFPVAVNLDEVVVTGTGGAVRRRSLGNSITTLDVADLTSKTTVVNVTEVLQSKTPGVTVLPGSGAPGTAGELRIRGASSLAGYKPVVFIDGVRYNIDEIGAFSATGGGTAGLAQSSQTTSALNNLNPNDIESIEIVKGPAAATLYGAEAANGVIQIITKKGTRGQQKITWSYRGERGSNKWMDLPETNYTTCDAIKVAARQSDGRPTWPGCQSVPLNTILTDNPLERDARALRVGTLSRNSLNLRGGGDRYSYYIAGDRDVEQGVFYNSDNSRTSVRSNFGFNPNGKSDIGINLNWQKGRLRLPIQDESANGLLLSARRGKPGRISTIGEENVGWGAIAPPQANRYKNFTDTERLTLAATASYNPASWFQNRLTVGIDNTSSQAQVLFLPGDIDATQDPDAASGANLRKNPTREILTIDYAGTLVWNLRPSLEATTKFGSQIIKDESKSLNTTGVGIGAPDVTLCNLLQRCNGAESFSENNSVGYYVQEQFGWHDRLFLTAAVRADDHSSFGTDFDLITYPKVSLSYVISEEPGFRRIFDATRISSLKLRTAWGEAGRAPTAYSAPQTYTVDRVTLGTTTASALRNAGFGNPGLKAERGSELELGFDLGLFRERIGVDFTYYNKKTKDMLQAIAIPPSTGFLGTRLANLGEVVNRGVEMSMFGTLLRRSNIAWDTRFNISTNHNELLSFGVAGKLLETPSGQAYGSVQQHRPGFPLGGFWVTPPQRDANGVAILTPTGAAIFNAGDTARRYIGPSTPTREMSLSNTFTLFRIFRLYALLDHKGGFFVFNLQERNRCQSNDNCWRVNNPVARFPKTAADSVLFKELAVYRSTSVSPEWIQKGDFTKLRELSLTIDLPARLIRPTGAQNASFVFSARNLAIWSDYEGVDPEVNSYGGRNFVRVDAYASPAPRRLTAAINLGF